METPKVEWKLGWHWSLLVAQVGDMTLEVSAYADGESTWTIKPVMNTILRETCDTKKRAIERCEWVALQLWKARQWDAQQKPGFRWCKPEELGKGSTIPTTIPDTSKTHPFIQPTKEAP